MQLINTLTLPTAKFVSLSFLLQLHHEDFSPHAARNRHNDVDVDEIRTAARRRPPPTTNAASMPNPSSHRLPGTFRGALDHSIHRRRDGEDTSYRIEGPLRRFIGTILHRFSGQGIDNSQLSTLPCFSGQGIDNSQLSTLPSENDGFGNIKRAEVKRYHRALSHSVLWHDVTTLSPFCLLGEETTQLSIECLRRQMTFTIPE